MGVEGLLCAWVPPEAWRHTTGEVAVGSVSELVLWGPTQGARPLGRGVARTPTQGLGCPSRRTSGIVERLSQRTALSAESWLESGVSRSSTQQLERVGYLGRILSRPRK